MKRQRERQQQNPTSKWPELPNCLLSLSLSFCSRIDVAVCQRICRTWRLPPSKKAKLFKELYERDFDWVVQAPLPAPWCLPSFVERPYERMINAQQKWLQGTENKMRHKLVAKSAFTSHGVTSLVLSTVPNQPISARLIASFGTPYLQVWNLAQNRLETSRSFGTGIEFSNLHAFFDPQANEPQLLAYSHHQYGIHRLSLPALELQGEAFQAYDCFSGERLDLTLRYPGATSVSPDAKWLLACYTSYTETTSIWLWALSEGSDINNNNNNNNNNPKQPVARIDGLAAWVNRCAMENANAFQVDWEQNRVYFGSSERPQLTVLDIRLEQKAIQVVGTVDFRDHFTHTKGFTRRVGTVVVWQQDKWGDSANGRPRVLVNLRDSCDMQNRLLGYDDASFCERRLPAANAPDYKFPKPPIYVHRIDVLGPSVLLCSNGVTVVAFDRRQMHQHSQLNIPAYDHIMAIHPLAIFVVNYQGDLYVLSPCCDE